MVQDCVFGLRKWTEVSICGIAVSDFGWGPRFIEDLWQARACQGLET